MRQRDLLAALFLSVAVLPAQAQPAPQNIPVPVPMPEQESRFYAFLRDFKPEALKAGIMETTYDRAVLGIALNPRIEDLNEKQPEFVRSIWDYLAGVLTEARISRGRQLIADDAALFSRLQDTYG